MEIVVGNILADLLFFVGIVWLVGFLIFLLNRLFYKLFNYNRGVCYATGLIGTPIHELSHALGCLVFGHKIREMKLFTIDRATGTLGYVNHSYNKKNLYQVAGNYFIGTAPIFMGTLFLWGMLFLLLPDSASEVERYLSDLSATLSGGASTEWGIAFLEAFFGMLGIAFASLGEGWGGVIFFLVALCVAIHMNLSQEDIRNSLGALPILLLLSIVFHALLSLISWDLYETAVEGIHLVGSYLTGILLLSLVLSVIAVLIALLIRGIIELFKKNFGK